MVDAMLGQLETDLRTALANCVTNFVATARIRLEQAHADIAEDEDRAKAFAEMDARRTELGREVAAMHQHKEAQEGRVELNIGGYRFHTSVQALRRVPHTFFDAYFSGRYAQDVCDDGSIFVDRDGEHFGHVLEYMRDGHISVVEPGMRPSVSLLRALKREFGFYCIELSAEEPVEAEQPELAFVMGGKEDHDHHAMSSMDCYDSSSDQWSTAADMGTARSHFGACAVAGELNVTGGEDYGNYLSSVERYSPSSDTWSTVAHMPEVRSEHAAVAVGLVMYVLGGWLGVGGAENVATASVLKFDSAPGTCSRVADMPDPVLCVCCVCHRERRLHIWRI
jgi:hypothetical protein